MDPDTKMAEPDYTLASKVYQQPNPLDTAKSFQQYNILSNEAKKTGLEAHQKEVDVNSLANYRNSRNAKDLEGASPELRSSTLSGDKTEMDIKKDTISRDAQYIAGEKDPVMKKKLWQLKGDSYVDKGWMPKEVWDLHRDNPSDAVLENLQRGNTSLPEWRDTTGQHAGADAAARAPYEGVQRDPTKPFEYPAAQPGGPLGNGSPVGRTLTNPQGAGAPISAPGAAQPQPKPPGTVNLTDTNATVLPPKPGTVAPGVPGTPSAAPGTNAVPVNKTPTKLPYEDEVPEFKVGQDMPSGPGIVHPGIDPIRQEARATGLKQFNEDIQPKAAAASRNISNLGTMKAELDSGKVTTSSLAPIQETIAGYMNAFGMDPKTIKGATGVDLANQQTMEKSTVRQGLGYSKDTIGGREAYNSIQISLKANPSMMTSVDGNKQIVNSMIQGEKYDLERGKAAQAWMKKNDGSMTGFDNWWNKDHSPATFISKAIPYPVPQGGKSEMQNGVTYEFNFGGKKARGTYNAETGHLDPVAQ